MKKLHVKVMTAVLCILLVISLVPGDASAAVPSRPTGLTATQLNSNLISLSWNYSSYATHYYVYRSTSYYGTYDIISSVTSTSYQDTNLNANTTYYYKVRAYNSTDISSESEIVSITVSNYLSDIMATPSGTNSIALTWTNVGSAHSYRILRSTSYSGTYNYIAASSSTGYTDNNLPSGTTYYYKVEAVSSSGTVIYCTPVANATVGNNPDMPINSERLAGSNRYETSQAISKSGWTSSYYAVVVSGENYPDALCSTTLAAKHNAPILLTAKGSLNTRTRDELVRLNVRSVFLIGGVNVISAGTEQAIRNLGISVTRIAGVDRYDTSLKIAQAVGNYGEAVIATGENYTDALSIAPIAAMRKMPILLTPKNSLPSDMRQYLQSNVGKTYVVGGTNAVSVSVQNQLPYPERLSGSNRYQTNIEIINRFINELNLGTVYLATGQTFPDALAGSVLAGRTNSPLILVNYPLDNATNNFIQEKRFSITKLSAFGGTNVIPAALVSSLSNSVSSSALSTPTGLTATSYGFNQIYLYWNPVSSAKHYYIYRSNYYDGPYTLLTSVTSPGYTDNSGLVLNNTYYYKITAVNDRGSSSYSYIVSATTSYGSLSSPSGLSATAQNSTRINLSWDSVINATYYEIYRSISSGSYYRVISVSSTDYSDTGLEPNTIYNYKITANNNDSSSSYSSEVSARTAPAAPTLAAVSGGETSINLSWNSVSGAHRYVVYKADTSGGTYSVLATISAPETTYSHTGLTAGTTCYYKVLARNSNGLDGDFSAVVSATTDGGVPAVPGVPAGLTATPADGLADGSFEVNLSWTAVPTATSYSISRSTTAVGGYAVIEAAAATNSYTDSDAALTANTEYYYKVKANNAAGSSADCEAVSTLTAPAIPGNLLANADSQTQITITWDTVAGADSYEVYWDGEDTPRATVPGPICVDSLLTADTTYNYKIKAVNSGGTKSAFSAVASATTNP